MTQLGATLKKTLRAAIVYLLINFAHGQLLNAQAVTYQGLYTMPTYVPEEQNYGGVVQGEDGSFYGATQSGVFYDFDLAGDFTKLYEYPDEGLNATPYAIIQGGDGNIYGANGGIFRLTPSGEYSNFINLAGANSLVFGNDGYYYATATEGGNSGCDGNLGCGEIVRFTLDGKLSALYKFTGGADGGYPAGLMQASDGNLYGYSLIGGNTSCSTGGGGEYISPGCGNLFRLTLAGKLTTLADASTSGEYSTPIEAGDGSLYEADNPEDGPATILKISLPSDEISTFYKFSQGGLGSLIAGSGQFIYGAEGMGVFALETSGQFYSTNPAGAPGAFTLASDGNAYGNNDGQIFRLKITPPLPAPVQVTVSPSSVAKGKPVTGTLKVNNAFSLTMQQCYSFVTSGGETTPLGLVPGKYNPSSKLYTFSTTFTPTQAGTYTYAVTCGGIESGSATLTVE
jgi:hypothetical protein